MKNEFKKKQSVQYAIFITMVNDMNVCVCMRKILVGFYSVLPTVNTAQVHNYHNVQMAYGVIRKIHYSYSLLMHVTQIHACCRVPSEKGTKSM